MCKPNKTKRTTERNHTAAWHPRSSTDASAMTSPMSDKNCRCMAAGSREKADYCHDGTNRKYCTGSCRTGSIGGIVFCTTVTTL